MVTHHAKKLDGREVKRDVRSGDKRRPQSRRIDRFGGQPGTPIGYMHVVNWHCPVTVLSRMPNDVRATSTIF
jgi:hypothetical protein